MFAAELRCRNHREVTVGALVLAEWDVEVNAEASVVGHGARVAEPGNRAASSSGTPRCYAAAALSQSGVHYETLENGLVLLLREAHSAPVAEFQFAARVGSADELAGEAGLAHFHEHMLFKGTASRGVEEIAGAIEGAGGRVNAYTSFDNTVYHATVPTAAPGSADLALDVLVDMVRRARFDPEDLAREIEVVIEEIRRSDDSPHHVCGDALFAEHYHAHPYGAPILGTAESVAGFTPERVRAFFERWYAPDNLTVVAAGDFDAATLAERLREAFAGATPRGAHHARTPEPPQRALRCRLLRRSFERACLEMAWPAVALADPDAPYLDLLAFILGGGDSSRLFRIVKERDGLVDRIDAHCYTPLDPGVFGVSMDLEAERGSAAVEAVVREIERVAAEGVEAAELEKARANLLAAESFERESVSGLARKLGSFELLAGSWRLADRYLDAVRSANGEDLLRAARTYLLECALAIAAVVPEGTEPEFDEKELARAVARGVEGARERLREPTRRANGGGGDAGVGVRGHPSRGAGAADLFAFDLPCGTALYVEPRRDLEVMALRGAMLGGLLYETEENAGLAQFLTGMWSRGTRDLSAAELARAIESIAAEVSGFAGRSSIGIALDAPSEHWERGVDLMAEMLLEPAFAPEEMERERRETLAAIARREDRLGGRVFDLFAATLWREHPYRLPLLGYAASVSRFAREDLLAQQARLVRGSNLVLAVAGDVDPDACASALARRLAPLDRTPFEAPMPPLEVPPREIRVAELQKERAQCHLVVGFRGLSVDDPDRHALEVLVQLLSGQGGRLFLELRDRQGLAYAVSAMNVEGVAPGFFAVYIACAPEKLDAARAGIFAELDRVLQRTPDESELERARRYLIGNHAIDRQRSASRATHMALDARYGLGPAAAWNYPDEIAAVDGETLLRVARRVLDLEAYTLALIRP